MNRAGSLVILVAVGLAAVGCEKRPTDVEARRAREVDVAQLAAEANKPVVPRVLAAGNHQVVVIEVPSVVLDVMVERQRCYVWRDMEFKTASMSCPGDRQGDISLQE